MTLIDESFATTYFNHNVKVLLNFIESFNLKITKFSIRKKAITFNNFPLLSLQDFCDIFNSYGFEVLTPTLTSEYLLKINIPFIAYLEYQSSKKREGYFVSVKNIDIESGVINYFNPYLGEVSELLELFKEKWSGIVLIVIPNDIAGENYFEEALKNEKKADNFYLEKVKVLDDVLSEDECLSIIESCENKYKASEVYIEGDAMVSNHRTSYSATFDFESNSNLYDKILTITENLTKINRQNIEPLHIARYTAGQEFKEHFDADKFIHRTHTIVIYLNDNFKGGETYFPEINFKVSPKVGRLLLFESIDNNAVILQSVHQGMPVNEGIKYICVVLCKM